MSRFTDWLETEMARANLNYSGLAALVHVKPNSARAWAIGESLPKPENCQQLARVFRTSLEDIYQMLGWLPMGDSEVSVTQRRLAHKSQRLNETNASYTEALVDAMLDDQESAREAGNTGDEGGESLQ